MPNLHRTDEGNFLLSMLRDIWDRGMTADEMESLCNTAVAHFRKEESERKAMAEVHRKQAEFRRKRQPQYKPKKQNSFLKVIK